ncbi:MAG TPA: CsbD family protein [Terriglobales bacterium]|nr:CsbD family protein [Terriglobales bacterium]
MNWDQMEGKWKQVKGAVKTRWGKLTDDDLDVIAGQKDQLVGRIQERYGIQKDQAQREVEEWGRTLDQENEIERERLRRAG